MSNDSNDPVLDLADCTEFRQTQLARPPGIVHGTAILLTTLLGIALAWSALVEADLVVRAIGYIRPVNPPRQVFIDFHGNFSGVTLRTAVAEVTYQQGTEVNEGDVLIRMDTRRLESESSKLDLTIQGGEKELTQISDQEKLLAQQFERASAEVEAELEQTKKEIQRAKALQVCDIQQATAELELTQEKLTRVRTLAASHSASATEELQEIRARSRKARGELEKARLPIVEDKIEVLRRKRERIEKDYQVDRMKLEREKGIKQRELEIARNERTRLELERQRSIIRAPIRGVVISREVKVGDIPEPGKPVVEIAEKNGFYFEADVSSEEIGLLREHLPARVKLDAFDYQKYGTLDGTVCFISPDSKVVEGQRVAKYLVKVELKGDEVRRGELRGQAKFGMAGQVEIVTEQESLLSILIRRIRQSISLG
jgi:multidrug resistance efflux pump